MKYTLQATSSPAIGLLQASLHDITAVLHDNETPRRQAGLASPMLIVSSVRPTQPPQLAEQVLQLPAVTTVGPLRILERFRLSGGSCATVASNEDCLRCAPRLAFTGFCLQSLVSSWKFWPVHHH